MAADLKLHATRLAGGSDVDEEDFALFFNGTMGSKWFNPALQRQPGQRELWSALYEKFALLPTFWIGEVSWLKASLLGDSESYVPDPVQAISDIVGQDLPVIDDVLIERLVAAMDCQNQTEYAVTTDAAELKAWLSLHHGWRIFTISW
jgi:hypothetical protein